METTEITQPLPVASPIARSEPDPYQQCDECGAAVDHHQRYCVVCGAHRRHVHDPAARYLSQVTARSRAARSGPAGQRRGRVPTRSRGLGIALALALIPVAAAAGVEAGRSSDNQDSALIRALEQHQASAAVAPSAGAATTVTAATSAPGTKQTASRAHAKHARAGAAAASTKNGGKVVSQTQYGSVTQIAGAKPTQAQVQQGAADTQAVQKSTGKNYVNQQSNLPGTVVVP